jgi:hypothetical protein
MLALNYLNHPRLNRLPRRQTGGSRINKTLFSIPHPNLLPQGEKGIM